MEETLLRLSPLLYIDAAKFAEQARAEKVTIDDSGQTIWYAFSKGNEVLGLLGWDNWNWRIRGVFVLPEHRGKGYGQQMTEQLIEIIGKFWKPRWIEVWAFNPEFYRPRGFEEIGSRHTGSTIMRKMLQIP